MRQLTEDFLIDLAKACLIDGAFADTVIPHLKYSYLPSDPYKQVFKYLLDYQAAHKKTPTLGLLTESVKIKEALPILGKIREADVYDAKSQILEKFEWFVKAGRFIELNERITQLYNEGKQDEAITHQAKESQEIEAFSLQAQLLPRVFADFPAYLEQVQNLEYQASIKCATGIPQFDYYSHGGIDNGTGLLGIARSGGFKSTFLRSIGGHAAIRGRNVLHISSGDSTLKEIKDGYNAWWTGLSINNLREGRLEGADLRKIEAARQKWLSQAGEIYIKSFQQFHQASILDCRKELVSLLKTTQIGLVLFDYLEKFRPGKGGRYDGNDEGQRLKKMETAEAIVNIGTEFDVPVATVTQASNIEKEKWNNPGWVITRENISNLKATIDPFAYCITLNQTEDEGDQGIMRIHDEKRRHYKIFSSTATYYIAQDMDRGKFIDIGKTKELFWDEETKKPIKQVATRERQQQGERRRPVRRGEQGEVAQESNIQG